VTVSEPASFAEIVGALTLHELRLALRRGESLLATFVIPLVVLAFFSAVRPFDYSTDPPDITLPHPEVRATQFLLPGAVALAIVASSLVALGIATGYDRAYGVLKRLGGSPASRSAVVAAKIAATLTIELVQVALLLLAARWAYDVDLVIVGAAIVLGTAAFAGLGLLLAGTLRAEATLALTNALFLAALLLGGIIVPLDRLPGWLAAVAELLPAAALADALRIGLNGLPVDAGPRLVVLGVWAAVLVPLAAWRFRWD
jgi:ABC-2 type transport system permease protein